MTDWRKETNEEQLPTHIEECLLNKIAQVVDVCGKRIGGLVVIAVILELRDTLITSQYW